VRAVLAWARAVSRIRSASRGPSDRGWASLSAARAPRAARSRAARETLTDALRPAPWRSFRQQLIGADHRRVGGDGTVGAPVLDTGLELRERGRVRQRVVVRIQHRYVHEANPIVQPERGVPQAVGLLRRKLGEHLTDQARVLVGVLRIGPVPDDLGH